MTILDNPVWHALQTVHRAFAQGSSTAQRYKPGVLQLMGVADPKAAPFNELSDWLELGEKLYTVGDVPVLPANWQYVKQYDCLQMVCDTKANVPQPDVVKLENANLADMLTLINLVQPGFFYAQTPLLGDYFGVFQSGRLVAMAGERMRIDGFTEVSAVVTHPEFTGRGYAQQLVAQVVAKNLDKGVLPFLHVNAANERAVKVYEKLGFRTRRGVAFAQFELISK